MRAQIWLFLAVGAAFVQTRLDAQSLYNITPSAATAGGPGFQMTATGVAFTTGAAVQWNGSSLSTTFVDSHTLSAYVPASLIASPGTAAVTVLSKGHQLGPLPFEIVSFDGPIITGFSPGSYPAGNGVPVLKISGNGFVPGSIAQWNGTALPTTFVSATSLTATVAPSLATSAGSYDVTVVNPGGGTSPPAVFVLSNAGFDIDLIPTTKAAGGPDFSLLVIEGNGPYFSAACVVQWNGIPLATRLLNGNTLDATVPASLIAAAGGATITIGGSNINFHPATFQVIAATLISFVSPLSAAAGGPAFSLTVNGVGFVPGSTVLWNGSSLATTFVSASQLTAAVAANLIASPGTASLTVQMPGGALLGPYPFTVNSAVPVIAGMNSVPPAVAGGPGVTLTINGTGFLPADVVLWNGSPLSTTYVSPIQLTAAVPASMLVSAGTVSITVQSPSGNSNSVSCTVYAPPPTISSLSPASAQASGPTFTLTINGTGFQNGAYAIWKGGYSKLSCTFISSTQLTASVDAALISSPGTVTIYIQNPDGRYSPEVSYSITGIPVPSINPNGLPAAIAGGPAFTLPINGSNFVTGAVVQWNGSPMATTYMSGTNLNAAVAAALIASPGTASIKVVNPGGKTSNAVTLSIFAPSLSSLVTTSAPAGSPAISLKVTGNFFVAGCAVYWNGTALVTTWENDSWVTASVPASLLVTPGTANVTVVNPGNIVSNSVPFNILAPSITSLSPRSTSAGGPAFTLTVTGGGFYPGSIVQWNGSALPTNYSSSWELTASVSASLLASPGTATIRVLLPGGATTNDASFTIQPGVLAIASVNPLSVAAGGPSFGLTVNGSGFVPGSSVSWKSSDPSATYVLNTTYVSPAQIWASVPASLIAAPGTASVTVTNPGSVSSTAATITITTPTPQIYGSYPMSVTAGGPAFVLTVTGTGFLSGATVQWNGTTLATTYVSATQLTASVPQALTALPGSATIVVVNPWGTQSTSRTVAINAAIPAVTGLMPASATAGAQQSTIYVLGSGFLPASTVRWNSSPLATTYLSDSQLTAVVPASLVANTGTASVTVVNPGGAASGASAFTINPAAPAITGLSPKSTAAGGSAFTLVVYGTGYLSGAVVNWRGTVLATTYVSGSQLTAVVPANLITSPDTAQLMVINPGGAQSAFAAFTVSPDAAGRLAIATAASLPTATVGVPYSQAMAATGGFPPYRDWTVVDPNDLPPGISLVPGAAVGSASLTGTSMVTGRFSFSVRVTDSVDATAVQQLNLTINTGALSISANGIVSAASYAGGNVAPGEIVTVFGSGFGPNTLATLQLDGRGYVGTMVADTQVLFDGIPGAMIYAVAGQVSAVVPYAISRMSSVPVQVTYQGQASNIVSVPVSTAVPGIFTGDASGHGQGAIVNQDGTMNSPDNPAPVGSVISLYTTGEGQTVPDGVDGKPAVYPAPVPVAQPVSARIGGVSAPVQYAGGAPGEVAGVMQVNVQIPQGLSASSAIPIVIRVGGHESQTNVTLAIK
jgi:uncharacterized protein (TIGR03437 family)